MHEYELIWTVQQCQSFDAVLYGIAILGSIQIDVWFGGIALRASRCNSLLAGEVCFHAYRGP